MNKPMAIENKMGSNIYSQFGEGECDLCVAAIMEDVGKEIREANPHFFADNGKGNLLTASSDLFCKKMRLEANKRVKKCRVWHVDCGFCFEPFGVCAEHLQEILQELEKGP